MRVYRERNRVIRSMGFNDYAEYLLSDLWKGVRSQVLSERPFCEGCGKDATQVHHSAYRKKNLEGRDLRRLHSVCGGCHFSAEISQSGRSKAKPQTGDEKVTANSGR